MRGTNEEPHPLPAAEPLPPSPPAIEVNVPVHQGGQVVLQVAEEEMIQVPIDPDIIEVPAQNEVANSSVATPNHLVSILKKKDHSDSNSPANASPVTFSESVVERRSTERRSRRQGILKKRSSLDESQYLQCLSGDESCVLSIRRNSLGETRHGILKEPPSRDGSTCSQHTPDVGTPSEPHHGILKTAKPEDSPSLSCDPPKHVSISQAVILAVAEMEGQEDQLYDYEHDVRPILKSGHDQLNNCRKVRPILKKKYSSSETEENIRPILKSSRKSSREEIDSSDTESVRPCLKGEGNSIRAASSTESLAVVADRSAVEGAYQQGDREVDEVDNSVEGRVIEKPLISVAERIKSMESFMNQPRVQTRSANGRRLLDKDRFKTQPITVDEFSRYVVWQKSMGWHVARWDQ